MDLFSVNFFSKVGISSVVGQQGDDSEDSTSVGGTIAGLLMVIASLLIQSSQFVYEEVLLTNYSTAPQRMVGVEGLFGMVFIFNWMMIFSFVKCPAAEMCDVNLFLN